MARTTYVLALVLVAIAAGTVAQRKNAMTLDEKVKTLQDWLYKRPILSMNTDRWKNLVQMGPKNYSMIVMFTALSAGVNCPICKPAYDEFYVLANSFRYTYPELKSVYFAVVDYEEAPDIFQSLNLNTAPVLYHFPAKGQKKRQDQMDFQRYGIDADAMARFVQERTDVNIRILRPPNYAGPAVIMLLAMLVLGLLYMRRNNLEFLYNRTCWALICLGIVFAFMSGQMWNHIRSPPLIMTNPQTRETSFIHGSTQFQLVAETYIVALLYAAVTCGMIMLNDAADAEKGDNGKRRVFVFLGLGLVVVFFSLLISVFRAKYSGYPYSFLFH
ncbi:hypothetical protein L596_018815 [Steinernema carpocapsae]|uniref:Magnesium transporter protein 1 n=1 Tax=Steinernema carpocapsae TaxID=34508 RepID=A0A4U5N5S5_STECR|nr:hypothetical protein L596_018815 [Steinernema carpocapsae]